MGFKTTTMIEWLEAEAVAYGESPNPKDVGGELASQCTANRLRQFRDTLISIANCRNGVASHQAQATLIETGECAHFNSVYHYRGEDGDESAWRCHDCDRESINRLGAFE